MERSLDHVPCDAEACKYWQYFYKGCTGCVYNNIKLDSNGQCKSFIKKEEA